MINESNVNLLLELQTVVAKKEGISVQVAHMLLCSLAVTC